MSSVSARIDTIALRAGRLAVDLVPAIGGSIAAFQLDGIDVMRRLSDADRSNGSVLGVASFPMIPFANRVGGNAFNFDGRRYEFEANNPPEIYHVHGTAWQRAWTAKQTKQSKALLTLEVADPANYSYRASQHFDLYEDALILRTSVTNAGTRPMPFGFGHHPWFIRDADTVIQFRSHSFHLTEPEYMVGERIKLPDELSYDLPGPLPDRFRCSDYGGWDGNATISFPTRGVGLTMQADPIYKHLFLFADPSRAVFCIEPQTNAACAFNRAGGFTDPEEGLIILVPGQTVAANLRFEPFRI
jgi:aldose 1-epimerase